MILVNALLEVLFCVVNLKVVGISREPMFYLKSDCHGYILFIGIISVQIRYKINSPNFSLRPTLNACRQTDSALHFYLEFAANKKINLQVDRFNS